MSDITPKDLAALGRALEPLRGVHLPVLALPADVLGHFEPSQIGTLVGTLMDACIPHLDVLLGDKVLKTIGLKKHHGILGDREGYPDYLHTSGKRLELKLLYVDSPTLKMKKPPTPREPSARLTQKVTVKNVVPATDALLVVAHQLQELPSNPGVFSPAVIDFEVFSMIECIRARDKRLIESPGRWVGDYETPVVLSERGIARKAKGLPLSDSYGRKKSEGEDWNEDTNFGKLKRIPYAPLQAFLKKHAS